MWVSDPQPSILTTEVPNENSDDDCPPFLLPDSPIQQYHSDGNSNGAVLACRGMRSISSIQRAYSDLPDGDKKQKVCITTRKLSPFEFSEYKGVSARQESFKKKMITNCLHRVKHYDATSETLEPMLSTYDEIPHIFKREISTETDPMMTKLDSISARMTSFIDTEIFYMENCPLKSKANAIRDEETKQLDLEEKDPGLLRRTWLKEQMERSNAHADVKEKNVNALNHQSDNCTSLIKSATCPIMSMSVSEAIEKTRDKLRSVAWDGSSYTRKLTVLNEDGTTQKFERERKINYVTKKEYLNNLMQSTISVEQRMNSSDPYCDSELSAINPLETIYDESNDNYFAEMYADSSLSFSENIRVSRIAVGSMTSELRSKGEKNATVKACLSKKLSKYAIASVDISPGAYGPNEPEPELNTSDHPYLRHKIKPKLYPPTKKKSRTQTKKDDAASKGDVTVVAERAGPVGMPILPESINVDLRFIVRRRSINNEILFATYYASELAVMAARLYAKEDITKVIGEELFGAIDAEVDKAYARELKAAGIDVYGRDTIQAALLPKKIHTANGLRVGVVTEEEGVTSDPEDREDDDDYPVDLHFVSRTVIMKGELAPLTMMSKDDYKNKDKALPCLSDGNTFRNTAMFHGMFESRTVDGVERGCAKVHQGVRHVYKAMVSYRSRPAETTIFPSIAPVVARVEDVAKMWIYRRRDPDSWLKPGQTHIVLSKMPEKYVSYPKDKPGDGQRQYARSYAAPNSLWGNLYVTLAQYTNRTKPIKKVERTNLLATIKAHGLSAICSGGLASSGIPTLLPSVEGPRELMGVSQKKIPAVNRYFVEGNTVPIIVSEKKLEDTIKMAHSSKAPLKKNEDQK
eukprot:Tbor_TRINITY_DN5555_c2_g2::TRINITY_DN5555_c2_g2_i1::g.13282::m.13282